MRRSDTFREVGRQSRTRGGHKVVEIGGVPVPLLRRTSPRSCVPDQRFFVPSAVPERARPWGRAQSVSAPAGLSRGEGRSRNGRSRNARCHSGREDSRKEATPDFSRDATAASAAAPTAVEGRLPSAHVSSSTIHERCCGECQAYSSWNQLVGCSDGSKARPDLSTP